MRRWRLPAAAAALAAMVVAGPLVSAGPAQAAPHREAYAFMNHAGVGQTGYVDVSGVQIVICPQCHQWIGVDVDLPADAVQRFNEELLLGVQALGRAAAEADGPLRQRSRDAALQAFNAAANIAGRTSLRTAEVGYVDPDRGVVVSQDLPWLAAAAQDLIDGVTALQESPTLPLPPPRAALAMARFDEAYDELTGPLPIGS